jgi:NAD(P)-dependent dehydrogenase (short-subunit alcohol dehydrogenase family)
VHSPAPTPETLMNTLDRSVSLRLENQVAVVSGGARGIGSGIVRRFGEEGARVVFSDLLDVKERRFKRNSARTSHFNVQTPQVLLTQRRS